MKSHKTPKPVRSGRTLSLTPHWACRLALITSCVEGVGPSTPAEVSLSSSESAKARAAAQANNELHLRSQAACARPRSNSGSSRTLAEARPVRNCAVSAENRPPTSPARTRSPASVTHQLGTTPFLPAPCHFQACSTLVHSSRLGVTCSSQRTHERVHCNLSSLEKSNPSTTTSSRLVSNWLTTPKSKSRTKTFVRTLPPEFLPQHTPTGGGQRRREDGHTGKREL